MEELRSIAKQLVTPGKGILAADESFPTIEKRFKAIGVESTEENRRAYRELLFTTSGIEEFISGVIMFDETIRQKTKDGKPFPEVLKEKGIVAGIKVDQGTQDYVGHPGEKVTKGLEGLSERLSEYRNLGAKFTKWRAVIAIGQGIPTDDCILKNAKRLAEFAAISQQQGMVPIVEPEVLMDGDHDIKRSGEVTEKTLRAVFKELLAKKIDLSGMLLKPNFVHPGKDAQRVTSREVAEATLRVLKNTVPSSVPGVVFLSGGDSPQESTEHLDSMNEMGGVPWQLSFSFGRALQDPVMRAWGGREENVKIARIAFYERARLNSLARSGKYKVSMEK